MSVPNQKLCFLNRKKREPNEEYINFIKEDTFNILNILGTYGSVLTYIYLCGQIPHTMDGKEYISQSGSSRKLPYELSPQAIQKTFPDHRIETFEDGINNLINKGILTPIKGCNNLYLFDDIPLKYRSKRAEEYEKIKNIQAEEAYNLIHQEQLKDSAIEISKPAKYNWED